MVLFFYPMALIMEESEKVHGDKRSLRHTVLVKLIPLVHQCPWLMDGLKTWSGH